MRLLPGYFPIGVNIMSDSRGRDPMGQVYVLKLRGGKWYVGHTNRGIIRVLEHLRKGGKGGRFKGAKWTRKHRPASWKTALDHFDDGMTEDDEDRKTLAYMDEYGIENVRGGKWCYEELFPQTVRELERLIEKSKSDKDWKPIKRRKGPTYEEKMAAKKARRKKAREDRARPINESFVKMEARGAASTKKISEARRMPKFFRGSRWEGVPVESLYPPDHWLHDWEQYDEGLSMEFEEDWVWARGGGAKRGRDRIRPAPYRPYLRKVKRQCSGFGKKRKRCGLKQTTIPEDGFCKYHLYQAPLGHSQYQGDPDAYNPGMNDEGTLSHRQESILRGHIYEHGGGKITDRILLSFGYKSPQWRKKWLVDEPKRVPKQSGRKITR